MTESIDKDQHLTNLLNSQGNIAVTGFHDSVQGFHECNVRVAA